MPDNQVAFLETVANPGDIPEAQDRAVAAAEKDDLLEILLVVVLAEGADPHLGFPGIDAAGGQFQGTAANGAGDVGECQPEGSQPVKRHLDGDLVSANAADLDLGHRGKRRELVVDLVRQFLQRALGYVAVQDEPHHALAVCHLPELGAQGAGRERLYSIDGRLDVVQRLCHVRTGVHLNPHGRHARGSHGLDRLHVVQPADLVLDLDDDRLLHLVRCGAGIGHRDFDVVEGDGRPGFPFEAGQRHQPGGDDGPHQQVGGYAVARHVGERSGPFPVDTVVGTHGARPAPVRTSMPSVANRIPPVSTAPPLSRLPVTNTLSSARCSTRTGTMLTTPAVVHRPDLVARMQRGPR